MIYTLIPAPRSGKYISFEGIEGSGKTYYLIQLATKHPGRFHPVTELSKEGFGAKIVEILSHESDEFFRHGYPVSEALFFFSMKLFEFDKTILPLLNRGDMVIEDRSVDTNCLYAAILLEEKYGEANPYEYYKHLMKIRKMLSIFPEQTICFVPNFELALKRAQKRDKRKYNDSEISFLEKVFVGYKMICENEKERIYAVYPDRHQTEDIIHQLEDLLNL